MVAILGLVSALLYGASDFLGGIASRRMSPLLASALAFAVAVVVGGVALAIERPVWSTDAVALGAVAGVLGAIGTWALYACLAVGPMSVLSPGVAVIYAVLPAIVGIALGERFPPVGYLALVAVVVAAVLLSVTRSAEAVSAETVSAETGSAETGLDGAAPHRQRLSGRAIVYGVIAGVGFAGYIIVMDQTPPESGLLPLFADLVVALALFVVALAIGRIRNGPGELAGLRPGPGNRRTLYQALGAGALLVTGNILLVIGLHIGDLAVMGVLNSLYPLGTVVLALIILRERLTVVQGAGIVLGLAACAVLALV